MRSCFFAIAVFIFLANECLSQTDVGSNMPLPARPEAQLLSQLRTFIEENLFNDLSLSLKDIGRQLEILEQRSTDNYVDASLSRALVIHKRGVVAYGRYNCLEAIQHYQRALQIREALLPLSSGKDLLPDIILGYNNIGGCYLELKQPYLALKSLQSGLSLADTYRDRQKIAVLLQDLYIFTARVYTDIGDFDNALKYYNAARDIKLVPNKRTARALIETGGLYVNNLGQMERGIGYLREAESLVGKDGPVPDPDLQANIYNNLGIAFENLGRLDEAETAYLQSILINEDNENYQALAFNYNNLAVVYKKMDKLALAQQYLMKAKDLLTNSLQTQDYLDLVYDNLGDIACLQGNLTEGIRLDNEAMRVLVPSFSPRRLEHNPSLFRESIVDKYGLLTSLASKAETQAMLYQSADSLAYALNTFELADSLIDMIRTEFRADASKVSLASRAKPIYEHAIHLCWRLYDATANQKFVEKAFRFSEKSRSIILLEAVLGLKASFGLPDTLAKMEQSLNLKKNYYEKQLALLMQDKDRDAKMEAGLRDSLLLYQRRHDAMLKSIEERYFDYFQFKFNVETTGIEALSKGLGRDQTFLEYFVGDSSIFIFIINRNEAPQFRKVSKTFPLNEWVEELKWVKDQNQRPNPSSEFFQPAFKIYQHLFAPFEEHLREGLTIVTDGVLGYVSFDMLPSRLPGQERLYYRNFQDYLLQRYRISYRYSASLQQDASNPIVKEENTMLTVAPLFEKRFSLDGNAFSPLEWNRSMAQQINILFKGRLFINKESLKDSFLYHAPHYRILQLATHALANDSLGDLSFILFGSNPKDILYAKDLYGLKLGADLVVLSACQGGGGELQQGEGIISLARGFFHAGCATVIPTLWTVEDEATKDLTIAFYKHLATGKAKDEALWQAKLDYLNQLEAKDDDKAHPYYWAAFVPIGNMTPLTKPPLAWFLWRLAIVLGLGGVLYLLYWWFYRKKKQVSNSLE